MCVWRLCVGTCISWLKSTTPKCTFSFCQNFLNHWKCYRVMTLLTWKKYIVKLPQKWAKVLFAVTLQVRNYYHKYALQANELWLLSWQYHRRKFERSHLNNSWILTNFCPVQPLRPTLKWSLQLLHLFMPVKLLPWGVGVSGRWQHLLFSSSPGVVGPLSVHTWHPALICGSKKLSAYDSSHTLSNIQGTPWPWR